MGRFCNGLLTAFRVIQLLLSLTVLGCGAFIVYEMFSLSGSAHDIENSILLLQSASERQSIEQALASTITVDDDTLQGFADVLNTVLVPVLHQLEGTPVRAIIITAVALWSISFITYLFFTHRAAAKTTNSRPPTRAIRVTLELLTLLLWIVSIVCAAMLAVEFGVIALAGGAETRAAFTGLRPLIEKALEKVVDDSAVIRSLDIVDEIVTIGALSILTVVSASICAVVSLVSLIVACCTSGKPKKTSQKDYTRASGNEAGEPLGADYYIEKNSPYSSVTDMSPAPAIWQSPVTPATPATHYYQNQGYDSVPNHDSR